ncbi:unnamed protein product [Aphanomyces euteiches]
MWKRGHTFPTMKRVFCVLEGSMLSVYNTEHEHDRGHAPYKVIEVTQVQPWDGRTAFKHYDHGFQVVALGGKTYQCSVDSALLQKEWTDAIQSSLEEPYRIVADEIIQAQKQLNSDVRDEHELADAAAEAVQRAEVASKAIKGGEENIQLLKQKQAVLLEKLAAATQEHTDAERKAKDVLDQSNAAKDAAHEDIIRHANEPAKVSEELKKSAAKLAAMYEIEANVASTVQKTVHDLTMEIKQMDADIAAAVEELNKLKANAEQTIQNATGAIHSAQTAKVKVKLRLASWTSSHSLVDALAQGQPPGTFYLKVKNTIQPKMHRKYFVLFGKTLCWYKDADDYIHNTRAPLGVVHVAGPIKDWNGHIGLTTYPNAFAIPTVEGKELHCSASVANEVSTWNVAILTGATMIPMSPERALDAKTRRDSFDLTSPPRHTHRQSFFASSPSLDIGKREPTPQTPNEESLPIVEGSLVKQGHFVPTMKRKYCVLIGVNIFFFDSHQHYIEARDEAGGSLSPTTPHVACSQVTRVDDWDGQLLLLTYPHGFQIDTAHHSHIHCSAASAAEKERWMKGIRAAIAHHTATQRNAVHHVAAETAVPLTDHARATLEFESILTNYFHEHNSAKDQDVYVLSKLFQGREADLLRQLDETYNTTLATDHAALVAKLSRYHNARLHDESAIETDGLIPHLEGMLQHKVHGVLSSSHPKIYAVLLGNKLLHFLTRIAALTEPDHPSVSIAFSEAQAVESLELKIVDAQGKAHKYEATSSVERDHWVRTMHLGLEFARAHHQRLTLKVSESTTLQEVMETVYDDSPDSVEFKQLVVAYYEQHNPDALASVEALLLHFRGKEHLLLESLDKIYHTSLASDPHMTRLCAALSNVALPIAKDGSPWRASLASDGSVPQHRKEGYVLVKFAPAIPTLKKCFCIIDETSVTCYSGMDKASTLLGPWDITHVSIGDGQFSLYIDTSDNHKIFGQLSNEVELHGWLSACHVAIARRHVTALTDTPLAHYLMSFYAKTNPSKVSDVPLLLDSFAGREIDLLHKIDAVYHSRLASDPAVLALLPSPTPTTKLSSPWIEGYFMKKGYMIPSMTKFYGVLKPPATLHVYDTKEDAANVVSVHHPKTIAAVTDWTGSTHDKYKFGLEFVTMDHRTYFCAFAAEDDKIRWMGAMQHGLAMQRVEARVASGALLSSTTKTIRDHIIHAYSHVSQNFVHELNGVLELSHGFDVDVLKMLDKKYGTHMAMDPEITDLLDTPAVSPGPFEAPLRLTSADGQTSQSLFGVLDGVALKLYGSREGFKSSLLQPQVTIKCLAVAPWTEMGLVIDTEDGTPVYLMGDSPKQTAKWIDEVQTALDKSTLSHLIHSVPANDENVFSSFLSILENDGRSLERRYVVLEELEIKLFESPDALEPLKSFVVEAIGPWNTSLALPTPPKFPFQLDCMGPQGRVTLLCDADDAEVKAQWEMHVADSLKRQAGYDLIKDQAFEVDHAATLGPSSQPATIKGYMTYRYNHKHKFGDAQEGFFVLEKDRLLMFGDEADATSIEATPQWSITIQSLFEAQAKSLQDFYVQAKTEDNTIVTIQFIPPDANDRQIWMLAIASALNESRGQTILHEQELEQRTQSAIRHAMDPRAGFVVANSTMEGELQRANEAFMHVSRDARRYYVLVKDTMSWYANKTEAEDSSSNNSDDVTASSSLKVLGVSDWVIPHRSIQSGFQVDVKIDETVDRVHFMADSVEDKEKWIRNLKAACDEAVAEQSLRDMLTRQATLKTQLSIGPIFLEGFVHLRRAHFAAAWKEHYCVLKGPWLSMYATREEYTTKAKPSSKVEVVFVGEWHGAVSAGVKNTFRIETIELGFIEMYVDDPRDKPRWMETLKDAIATLKADELVTRDMTLPSYPGATMEGYLTKHGGKIRGSLKRYCVLLRTLWLYFASQDDALGGVDPLGTLQVIGIEPTTSEGIVPEHSFLLLTTGNKDKLCCEAHSGAEKQLWVDAIKSELELEEKLRGDIRLAEERERTKAEQLQATVNKARAINQEAAARDAEMEETLKQLERFNSNGVDADDDDDDDENDQGLTPYVEYVDVDNAPENSPVRRASKSKLQKAQPVPAAEPQPFWTSWCRCFSRPPLDAMKLRHDPGLTEHERRLYSCEYYSNGTIDTSL